MFLSNRADTFPNLDNVLLQTVACVSVDGHKHTDLLIENGAERANIQNVA